MIGLMKMIKIDDVISAEYILFSLRQGKIIINNDNLRTLRKVAEND